jgi:hypothetical protein
VYGKADPELADHLEELGDSLTYGGDRSTMLEFIREAKREKE